MKVISIGDLVTDFYYKNGNLIGVNGGMSSHNIIANLSKYKIDTAVYGVCGNDDVGEDIYSHVSIEEKFEAIKMITYKEQKKLYILASNQ